MGEGQGGALSPTITPPSTEVQSRVCRESMEEPGLLRVCKGGTRAPLQCQCDLPMGEEEKASGPKSKTGGLEVVGGVQVCRKEGPGMSLVQTRLLHEDSTDRGNCSGPAP